MGSLHFAGVRFSLYPDDHLPVHIHARYAGVTVVLELRADGRVVISDRLRSVQPANAKRSDVARIVRVANLHVDALMAVWKTMHP